MWLKQVIRPNAFILATVPNAKVAKALAFNYGVLPVITGLYNSTDELVKDGKQRAESFMNLQSGDKIVISGGFPNTGKQATNFMKIEEI